MRGVELDMTFSGTLVCVSPPNSPSAFLLPVVVLKKRDYLHHSLMDCRSPCADPAVRPLRYAVDGPTLISLSLVPPLITAAYSLPFVPVYPCSPSRSTPHA